MKTLVANLLIIKVLGLSACETMKGLGGDISSAKNQPVNK